MEYSWTITGKPEEGGGVCSVARTRLICFFCSDGTADWAARLGEDGLLLRPVTEETRQRVGRRFAPPLSAFAFFCEDGLPERRCEGAEAEQLLRALSGALSRR